MLTPDTRHRDFPALDSMIYLNTAAESIPPLCVGAALQSYWHDKLRGMRGRDLHFQEVEYCREVAARMTGFKTAEVAFCSCSSEAYNLLATALNLQMTDEVIVTDLDFPAGATPWLTASTRPKTHVWQAVQGELRVADLLPLLSARTQLVQVSLVSFYNGHRLAWAPFRDAVRCLAPNALISVDVTQALGRVVLDCQDADCLISSTHKWTLGVHGGCIVAIPERAADRLTTHAGGWFHLRNAFDVDRFQRADRKAGAASFSVGMPNFAAIYALNAALRYVEGVGVEAIAQHADPLLARVHAGLLELGIKPLAPAQPTNPSGIISFQHTNTAGIHAALERENIHVMHHAGRIRIAVAGYNTGEEVGRLLEVLAK